MEPNEKKISRLMKEISGSPPKIKNSRAGVKFCVVQYLEDNELEVQPVPHPNVKVGDKREFNFRGQGFWKATVLFIGAKNECKELVNPPTKKFKTADISRKRRNNRDTPVETGKEVGLSPSKKRRLRRKKKAAAARSRAAELSSNAGSQPSKVSVDVDATAECAVENPDETSDIDAERHITLPANEELDDDVENSIDDIVEAYNNGCEVQLTLPSAGAIPEAAPQELEPDIFAMQPEAAPQAIEPDIAMQPEAVPQEFELDLATQPEAAPQVALEETRGNDAAKAGSGAKNTQDSSYRSSQKRYLYFHLDMVLHFKFGAWVDQVLSTNVYHNHALLNGYRIGHTDRNLMEDQEFRAEIKSLMSQGFVPKTIKEVLVNPQGPDLQFSGDTCASLSLKDNEIVYSQKSAEEIFVSFPEQYRQHVLVQGKDPYTYDGPLVVLDKATLHVCGAEAHRNECVYCSKLVKNIKAHLIAKHKEEKDVKDIIDAPEDKAADMITLLKNKGNAKHNASAFEMRRGFLIPCRMSDNFRKPSELTTCKFCHGLVGRKNFRKHNKNCASDDGRKVQLSVKQNDLQQTLESSEEKAEREGKDELFIKQKVLPSMQDTQRAQLCEDPLIMAVLILHVSKKIHDQKLIKSTRDLANMICKFILILLSKHKSIGCVKDIFSAKNFDILYQELREFAKLDEEKIQDAHIRTLSPVLKNMASIHMHSAGKKFGATSDEYLDAMALYLSLTTNPLWNTTLFGRLTVQRSEEMMDKEQELPLENDIKLFVQHLKQIVTTEASLSIKNWKTMNLAAKRKAYDRVASSLIVLIMISSGCRIHEAASIFLSRYMRGEYPNSFARDESTNAIDTMTLKVKTSGKGSNKINVTILKSFQSAIEWVLSVRTEVGVPEENIYLFGKTSSDQYKDVSHFWKAEAIKSGAAKPHLLGCQGHRRLICTKADLMDLSQEDREDLDAKFGHCRSVAQQHYELKRDIRIHRNVSRVGIAHYAGCGDEFEGKKLSSMPMDKILSKEKPLLNFPTPVVRGAQKRAEKAVRQQKKGRNETPKANKSAKVLSSLLLKTQNKKDAAKKKS